MVKHIFVFLEIFSLEGGIQSYVKDVLNAYISIISSLDSKEQAEVFLLRDAPECINPYANNQQINFYYLKTLPAWKGRLKLALFLLKSLLKNHPKMVFCGHVYLSPLIALLCKPLGIPYTILTYGKEVWYPLPKIQKIALQNATEIWTISRYSRDNLCQANNIKPEKVKILPCVVDEKQFFPGDKPVNLINKYNLKNAKVLMTVARLWSGDIYKGVDVTIRALPKIISVFPNVKYLVIGRGDDQLRLAQLAKDLGVENQVIFAGFIPTVELPDLYRVADAYIMPSQEGFGIVYLEAMVSGIPVLSGNDDGSADPLQDGRLGWRVSHRDPDAVAKACLEILEGKDPRCHSQWLREETLKSFSKEALVTKLKSLLN